MYFVKNTKWYKRILYRTTTFLLIGIFCNQALLSQNRKPIFQTLQQGLSNQLINCILKDNKGFIWLGTGDGLNKFDGTNFVVYENNSEDSTSIGHNTINALMEDNSKNLWIGTADGLNLYNRDKDNFVNIKIPGIDRLYVSALCADNKGNIWIGAVGIGVILFDYKNNKFTFFSHNDADENSVSSSHTTSIVIDRTQNVWVATNNGLNFFNKERNNFTHFTYASADCDLTNDNISILYLDSKDNLWVGTLGKGLYEISSNNRSSISRYFQYNSNSKSISNNNILSLCEDKKGNLWIGNDNGGLNCLYSGTDNIISFHPEDGNTKGLNSNSIHSLYCDENNILWIGTHNHGINFIDEKFEKFESFQKNSFSKNSIQNNDVTDFTEDSHGNIWIATDGGGVCKFNLNTRVITKVIKDELSNSYVQNIICDKNDNLWVGTWNGGIDRFNKSGVKIKNYKVSGIRKTGDNKVTFLFEDKEGNVWAGTSGSGLFLCNKGSDKFIQVIDHLGHSGKSVIAYVTSIFEDSQRNIWVGTMDGLFYINRNNNEFSFTAFYAGRNPNSISSNRINVIFEDSKNNMWFGSHEKGLNLYDRRNKSFTKFQKQNGLPSNCIKGILEDKNGFFWVSTNKGISEFNAASATFKNYTKEDGLNSDEFYVNSCLKTRSGEFFFGGINGFNTFFPDSIKINTSAPPIYLTDFKIFNKSVPIGLKGSPLQKHVSETEKVVLSYNQNSFTIEFIALNYTRSSQNQYAYILEGLEKEWNYVKHKRSASYTYIQPGNYVFKVVGSNNDGVWNKTPTELRITILPPFWKTIWAYILYIVVIFALLFAYVRLAVIRAKQMQLLELDKMKLEFFANVSHELRTPITLILSPLESLLSSSKLEAELKSKLAMIHRNARRLYRLVNELMDFVKAEDSQLTLQVQPVDLVMFTKEVFEFYNNEAKQKSIDYNFVTKENSLEVLLDRDKMEKVILNLLSNAFKFTNPEGKITLIVEKLATIDGLDMEYARISVIDNGIGISEKYLDKIFDRFFQSPEDKSLIHTGTGIGLSLSKNLVKLHHGKIEVSSVKNKETCFSVYLPLGKSHFDESEIVELPLVIETYSSLENPQDDSPRYPENAHLIMIAEDNFDLRKYVVSQMAGKYRFIEAENGEDAYNLAIKEIPDLIISDILMPIMSGLEFCKKIKETVSTSHIPLILLTAKVTTDEKIEGIQTGADVYITKPFDIRFLYVTIKNLIETRYKLYQRFSQEVFIMPREYSNNSLDQEFLERVIDFIEKNISNEELIIKDLASHLLLSHSQTYRKIKALTGQSVSELIRTIRLKKAIKLMETGKYNVSEIAFEVGFTSPAYFTKCFREQFGKPPSEYLADFRTKNNPK